jgi:hypothetical protein
MHSRPALKTSRVFKAKRMGSPPIKNKLERLYEKLSLNSILYTSVIGIIGGVTAAQL